MEKPELIERSFLTHEPVTQTEIWRRKFEGNDSVDDLFFL